MAEFFMRAQPHDSLLHALKVAFCYMPKVIEVNSYDYGDDVERILADIAKVREELLARGLDPDEVEDEINPDRGGRSYY